ncbi:DNA-binding transcriptional regulator, GntR family [Devosia sp. YR412]|uniref:GntR family transcriptional regulator n=1 Tax=Devosia sp. YR412 TaxID=1881030 RepID=UPI0008AE50F6|nr:GntR family transcriptional regulator [Devosia sp. YR412]SEQ49169.1 DNA-binding transcriptional regulator, GntR family [Devosia sp. YR412]
MSTIQPIVGASLSSEALDMVVAAITSGEFQPGERLSEAELARRLGISRGPLREALGRLEGRLVTRTPRIGVRVIELSRRNIEDLFYTREALEGMGARLACERISAQEVARLRDLLNTDRSQPEVQAGEAYAPRSTDDDFHLSIVKAAHCEQIERLLMDQIYYQLRIHRRKSSTLPGRARAALVEHENIVIALEARDPDQAEKAMRTHLRNARLSAMAATSE